jgi:hypothetical protein
MAEMAGRLSKELLLLLWSISLMRLVPAKNAESVLSRFDGLIVCLMFRYAGTSQKMSTLGQER